MIEIDIQAELDEIVVNEEVEEVARPPAELDHQPQHESHTEDIQERDSENDDRFELEEEVNPGLKPVQEVEFEQEEISSTGSAIRTCKVDKHLLKEKDMI